MDPRAQRSGGRARHTEFGEPRRLVVGGRVEGLLERSQFDAVVFVGVPILWVIRTRAVIFRWFPLVFLSAVGKIHLGLGPEVKVHRQNIILGGFLADVEGEEGYNKEGDAADDVDEASVGNGLKSLAALSRCILMTCLVTVGVMLGFSRGPLRSTKRT